MADAILAIDQGTTNTKALLVGQDGTILASGTSPLQVRYPQPGWAETDGTAVLDSTLAAVADCLGKASASIAAIGISNQRETVLMWERATGAPLGPCIIWQCRRSAERIAALRTPEAERLVAVQSGLALDPLFPAAKIGWLLDEVPDARARAGRGELCVGTIDSWLLFNLTGGATLATDCSNASRTQLLDIRRLRWSSDLLDLFGVPPEVLAPPLPSDSRFGLTVAQGPLPAGIPIHAMMGDSHAALFGHGVRAPGAVKATYGTGSSLMTLTEDFATSDGGLSSTIAWRRGERTAYALEGNITVSGHAAAWAADMLGLEGPDALADLALTVDDSAGVVFVPALAGLGAPWWDTDARGLVCGLSLSSRPAHVARATFEAIAFQVGDVFAAMEKGIGGRMDRLLADGGPTANAMLMQMQADLLGRPVEIAATRELSAIGAAVMAGTGVGLWDDETARGMFSDRQTRYAPAIGEHDRSRRVDAWHEAISRARR